MNPEAVLGFCHPVSEFLYRRRRQTVEMVCNFHDRLGIPAGSFVKLCKFVR